MKATATAEAAGTAAEAVLQNEMDAVDSTSHQKHKNSTNSKIDSYSFKIYSKETDNHYSYETFCSILLLLNKCHMINSRQKRIASG